MTAAPASPSTPSVSTSRPSSPSGNGAVNITTALQNLGLDLEVKCNAKSTPGSNSAPSVALSFESSGVRVSASGVSELSVSFNVQSPRPSSESVIASTAESPSVVQDAGAETTEATTSHISSDKGKLPASPSVSEEAVARAKDGPRAQTPSQAAVRASDARVASRLEAIAPSTNQAAPADSDSAPHSSTTSMPTPSSPVLSESAPPSPTIFSLPPLLDPNTITSSAEQLASGIPATSRRQPRIETHVWPRQREFPEPEEQREFPGSEENYTPNRASHNRHTRNANRSTLGTSRQHLLHERLRERLGLGASHSMHSATGSRPYGHNQENSIFSGNHIPGSIHQHSAHGVNSGPFASDPPKLNSFHLSMVAPSISEDRSFGDRWPSVACPAIRNGPVPFSSIATECHSFQPPDFNGAPLPFREENASDTASFAQDLARTSFGEVPVRTRSPANSYTSAFGGSSTASVFGAPGSRTSNAPLITSPGSGSSARTSRLFGAPPLANRLAQVMSGSSPSATSSTPFGNSTGSGFMRHGDRVQVSDFRPYSESESTAGRSATLNFQSLSAMTENRQESHEEHRLRAYEALSDDGTAGW